MKAIDLLNLDSDENGLGEIKIGTTLNSFEEKFINNEKFTNKKEYYKDFFSPNRLKYVFFDSINFEFNLNTSLLINIYLHNNYKGKYLGKVGLNNKVLDVLKTLKIEYHHDDDFLIIDNEHYKVAMWCNIDLDSASTNEAENAIIEGIRIMQPR